MVFVFNFEQQRPYSPSIIVRTNLITTVNWAFHRPAVHFSYSSSLSFAHRDAFILQQCSLQPIYIQMVNCGSLSMLLALLPPSPPSSHPFMFIVKDYSAKPSTLLLVYVLSAIGYSRSTEEALWEGIADLDLISFNEMESPLLSTHWPCNGHRH